MQFEIVGFAPDLDATTPGVLIDCGSLVPTIKGMAAANTRISAGFPTLATVPNAAFVGELLSGARRTLVSSTTAIYEAIGSAWVDRSRGGGYSGTNRQRYAVFGDAVLATNRTEPIQRALPGGSFADIASAPAALVLVPAAGFVIALNINGMTIGDQTDGWGCSAIRNEQSWTPSAATQCVAGRLLDSPGAIRAGAALGSDVVAYKASSMYLGRYVGSPKVWDWVRVPGDIGASGAESVVVFGTRHFFVGPDDFFMFDGTVPRPIGSPIRKWFFDRLSRTHRDKIVGVADLARDLVYWYYPSVATVSGEIDSCLVYNVRTDRWGLAHAPIQAALQYSSGQVTYDGLGALYSTYDSLPDIAYDSPFWLADQTLPGVLVGNVLYSLTGEPADSYFVTGDVGDLTRYSMLKRATPRYEQSPIVGAQGTNFHKSAIGESLTQDATIPLTRGRFDFRRAARWHRLRVAQQGACVINGMDIELQASGKE